MLRQFTDNHGVSWRVWNVDPTIQPLPGNKRRNAPTVQGWLVFESPQERRRLSPIPEDWTGLDDTGLAALRDRADVVPYIARNIDQRRHS